MSTDRPHAPRTGSGTDKRFANRRTIFVKGIISTPEASLSCVVRDTSSSGALLEVRDTGRGTPTLPETFTLLMPMERVAYECKLMWMRGKTAGVRFAGPARMIVKRSAMRQPQKKAVGMLGRLLGKKS